MILSISIIIRAWDLMGRDLIASAILAALFSSIINSCFLQSTNKNRKTSVVNMANYGAEILFIYTVKI